MGNQATVVIFNPPRRSPYDNGKDSKSRFVCRAVPQVSQNDSPVRLVPAIRDTQATLSASYTTGRYCAVKSSTTKLTPVARMYGYNYSTGPLRQPVSSAAAPRVVARSFVVKFSTFRPVASAPSRKFRGRKFRRRFRSDGGSPAAFPRTMSPVTFQAAALYFRFYEIPSQILPVASPRSWKIATLFRFTASCKAVYTP